MMTSGLEVRGRFFAAFRLNVVANLLAFVEALEARALDGADVDEHVLAAAVGLNEAETLCGVEPLNCACSHVYPRQLAQERALTTLAAFERSSPSSASEETALQRIAQDVMLTADMEPHHLARLKQLALIEETGSDFKLTDLGKRRLAMPGAPTRAN
jgi:hypothetical protein